MQDSKIALIVAANSLLTCLMAFALLCAWIDSGARFRGAAQALEGHDALLEALDGRLANVEEVGYLAGGDAYRARLDIDALARAAGVTFCR